MTPHQLRLFVSVAETRNLSATSARLRISQPAVTRQLHTLEEEYGIRLYFSKGRGVELTEEGERFLQHARNVLARVARLEGDFRPVSASQPLCIGACFQASASVMPGVMGDFLKSFPGVKVSVLTDSTMVLLRSILDGALDLALVLDLPPERESVTYEIVQYYTPVLVGPADHSLTRKNNVTARDLREVPLILLRNGPTSERTIALLRRAGVEPRVAMKCPNAEGIKTAVKAGLGFGLLFEELIAPELSTGSLRLVNLRMLKDINAPCYAVHAIDKPPGRMLRSFINLLHGYNEDHPGSVSPSS